MLNFISRWFYLFCGSSKLLTYERVCLDAWRSKQSSDIQQRLDHQLHKFDFIQRQARKTKSVFFNIRDPHYKNWSDDVLFPDRSMNKKVFTGLLTGKIDDIFETVGFCIYLHRGRLSSIEFDSEPGALTSITKGLQVDDARSEQIANRGHKLGTQIGDTH